MTALGGATASDNSLEPHEMRQGWRLLFDGATLDGWRSRDTEAPPAGWQVKDGAITRTAKSGDLISRDDFGDFELSLEWKVGRGANSGILYRIGLGDLAATRTWVEYQVLDNVAGNDRHTPSHRAGAIYELVAPAMDVTRPAGKWNTARVIVRGWEIEHWLNGTLVAKADLQSDAGRELIAKSRFRPSKTPAYASLLRGHIGLQDHGTLVSYRNIKIRELGPGRMSK